MIYLHGFLMLCSLAGLVIVLFAFGLGALPGAFALLFGAVQMGIGWTSARAIDRIERT